MEQNKKIGEPEENSQDFISGDETQYSILDEPINEKTYSRLNVSASQEQLNTDIPEPDFIPPPIDFSEQKKEKPKEKPIMPEMEGLSQKEKNDASETLSDVLLDGYGILHALANRGLMVSEKKLMKLQQNGEIDLNAQIQYDYGQTMSAGEFFQEYNKQAETALTLSNEFREEVKPVLSKVLAKKGLGLTDEQKLIFLFAKDAGQKAIIAISMRSQLNQMIEVIKSATVQQPQRNFTSPPPPPPQQPQQEQSSQTNASKSNEKEAQTMRDVRPEFEEPELVILGDMPKKKKRGRPSKKITDIE